MANRSRSARRLRRQRQLARREAESGKEKNMQDSKNTVRNRLTMDQMSKAAIFAAQQTEPMTVDEWLAAFNRRFTDAKSGTFSSKKQVECALKSAEKLHLLKEKGIPRSTKERKMRGLARIIERLIDNNGLKIPSEDLLVLQMISRGAKYQSPEEVAKEINAPVEVQGSMFSADD